MTETIVWGVLWFVVFWPLGAVATFYGGTGVGILVAYQTDKDAWLGLGLVLGWLGSIAWSVFALIQIVLHVVGLVQILTT